MHVVADDTDGLVLFQPVGSPFGFGAGDDWPTSTGRHPYDGRSSWVGEGVLGIHRAGDPYAVWHHWAGPERRFVCWYVNIQAPYLRAPIGIDSLDLELDLIVFPDGEVLVKDEEHVEASVGLGRFSEATGAAIHRIGASIREDVAAGRQWWDDRWVGWEPHPDLLVPPTLPVAWDAAPAVDRRDLELL
jgi:Protein of unknown function (DUF402)